MFRLEIRPHSEDELISRLNDRKYSFDEKARLIRECVEHEDISEEFANRDDD